MPAPVVYIVPAIITAVVTGYVFHRFVYEPHIAPALERMAEDFLASRRARARHLATPVGAGGPPPSGDIPLNERRRERRSSASTSEDSGDEESAPLLGAQSSTTAREGPNLNENVNVNATLRRRPFTAVPTVDNTVQEHPAPPFRAYSSPIAREESNNVSSTATLPTRPRPVAFDNNSNNNHLFGSEHHYHHQVTTVPTQDNRARFEPTVTIPPSPAPSSVSRSDVHEWRRSVALHGDRRRTGQGQPMRPAVDRRPLPSPSTVPAAPFVPTVPPVLSPPPPPPAAFHVLDEPNPDTLPQTPIYPTHVITDSSVPSTPSSTMSGGRNVMFTPSPQISSLRSSTISTNAGANVATGTNPSEISVLDPWNGAVSPKHGRLGVSVPSMAQSVTTASFQTDASGANSSISQLLVPPSNASGVGAPPQLPPLSPLSSMHASAHSNQPIPIKSPHLPTLQSPPPQTPRTPPYLLSPSAQHPHHVHYPAPPNISTVASSPTTVRGATAVATIAPAARSNPDPPMSPPLTSPVLSLSQSYPISLDQEQGIEVVSNPTPPASPFRSPTFSDPYDLVVPGSPGPFGSPGSPQSPFIPLSIPSLPISPPLPPRPDANGTGGQRQPLDLFGSAASMTGTIHPLSSFNPPLQSPSAATSMFYSFTNDASTATTRQTSPPARPPPAVQSGGVLSFPSDNHNQSQQNRFASPGIMSPMLSELDFVSEFGGSELGSNDDIGSESSWSSARF